MPADQSLFPSVIVRGLAVGNQKTITNVDQFPTPVGGIIYLPANTAWHIVGTVDLLGSRLVMQGPVAITGNSRTISTLQSTGLPAAQALISTTYVASLRLLSLLAPVGCSILNVVGTATAFFAYQVGFGDGVACGSAGAFSGTLSNVLVIECTFTNVTSGFSFDGTISSVVFEDSLFSSSTLTGSYATLAATLTAQTRIRFSGTVFRVFTGGTGITDLGATLPIAGFILLLCNFSGAGTYLNGISDTDIETRFVENVGITNTLSVAQLTMTNNVVSTPVTVNEWTPILGTVAVKNLARFTHLDRVVTYLDVGTNPFIIHASISLSTGNNQELEITFTKNGTAQPDYAAHVTSTGSGAVSSTAIIYFTQLSTNDSVGIAVKNLTSGSAVTINHMVFVATQVANT